jgi:hypothetical protein
VPAVADTITRAEVLSRARFWLNNPKIFYDQGASALNQLGNEFRTDCSGFVSMALFVTENFSTVGFPQVLTRLQSKDELKPGDVLGVLGPGTGGDAGHIALFIQWNDAGRTEFITWEHGGGEGDHAHPHAETHTWPWNRDESHQFLPYRFDSIVDAEPPRPGLGVAAVRDRHGAYHVFVIDGAGEMTQRIHTDKWHPAERLGGIVRGTPAVLYDGSRDRYDVLAIGDDGLLRQHTYKGGMWTGWTIIRGGDVEGGVGGVIDVHGTRHAFAVNERGTLYQRISDGQWNSWQALGGMVRGAPGVTYNAGRYDVFATDDQGHVVQQMYLNNKWNGWHPTVDGSVFPGIAALRDKHCAYHLFAVGKDGAVRQAIYDDEWHAWENLEGTIVGAPAVVYDDGRYDVFALTAQGDVQQQTYLKHKWRGWHPI